MTVYPVDISAAKRCGLIEAKCSSAASLAISSISAAKRCGLIEAP